MNKRLVAAIAVAAVVVAGAITGTAIVSYNNGMHFADSHPLEPRTVAVTTTATVATTSTTTATSTVTAAPVAELSNAPSVVDVAKCRTVMRAIQSSGSDAMADQIIAGSGFKDFALLQPVAAMSTALGAVSSENDDDLAGMPALRFATQSLWDLLMTPDRNESEDTAFLVAQVSFAAGVTSVRETCEPLI